MELRAIALILFASIYGTALPTPALADDVQRGQVLYEGHCLTCQALPFISGKNAS